MARLLHLHFHLRSITKSNPSPILFFSTSNSNSNSNSPFSSLFEDIRNNFKHQHQPQPSNPNPNPNSSTEQIRINLSEFRNNRTAPPPPQDLPQNHQISLQDIYQRKMGQTTTNSGGASSFNVQSMRESLQNISGKTPTSPLRRPSPLSESVFAKEMRKDGPASPSSSAATAFLKTYGVDLGKKLKMLRPEGKGKDWFFFWELNERLEKLRRMEERKVTLFDASRVGLQEMDQSKQKDTNKASLQGISKLSQLSGSPTFPLEPPKPHLVEKGMNDDSACTNATMSSVSIEDMVRSNNAVEAAIDANQEYSNNFNLKSREEELENCYARKKDVEKKHELENTSSRGTKRARTSLETQDHIISERKRRRDIAEKFIALSATIPGLKKIDEASVFREAINYIRQLQQRITVLEKGTNNESMKSLIITKSRLDLASCEKNSGNKYRANEVLPEVEARGLDKEVLIRIYCEKRKGILIKLFTLLKDVHLSITCNSILPFGNSILNIIIVAQMSEKYNLTVNDLVKTLKQDLVKLYEM